MRILVDAFECLDFGKKQMKFFYAFFGTRTH